MELVTEAELIRDAGKSKALLADVFKLLGNSAYGKFIEAKERQTNVKDEKVCDRALWGVFFEDPHEVGQAYEFVKPQEPDNYKATVPGWHRVVSAGQASDGQVLLILP